MQNSKNTVIPTKTNNATYVCLCGEYYLCKYYGYSFKTILPASLLNFLVLFSSFEVFIFVHTKYPLSLNLIALRLCCCGCFYCRFCCCCSISTHWQSLFLFCYCFLLRFAVFSFSSFFLLCLLCRLVCIFVFSFTELFLFQRCMRMPWLVVVVVAVSCFHFSCSSSVV